MSDSRHIDIVFDGPPAHESGRFVEVENDRGASVSVGQWIDRGDGTWALRLPAAGLLTNEAPATERECIAQEIESNGMISRRDLEDYWRGWDDATIKAAEIVRTYAYSDAHSCSSPDCSAEALATDVAPAARIEAEGRWGADIIETVPATERTTQQWLDLGMAAGFVLGAQWATREAPATEDEAERAASKAWRALTAEQRANYATGSHADAWIDGHMIATVSR